MATSCPAASAPLHEAAARQGRPAVRQRAGVEVWPRGDGGRQWSFFNKGNFPWRPDRPTDPLPRCVSLCSMTWRCARWACGPSTTISATFAPSRPFCVARQLDQREHNVGQSAINATVSALRLLFGVTLERPDLSHRLVLPRRPSKLPDVLSVEEGAKLLAAAPGIKYRAARRVAYASWAALVGGRPPQGPAAPVSGPQKQLDRLRKTAVRRPETVLACLSRYTHQVAISNSRLIRFDDTGVTLPLQKPSPRWCRSPAGDDAWRRRVHPPLPALCPAARVPPHPALRAARRRHPQGAPRTHPPVARRCVAA